MILCTARCYKNTPSHNDSLAGTTTRRPGHKPRDLSTADEKYKQNGGHEEKVHDEKASKPPGLVCCHSGSRTRPCGAQAAVSGVAGRGPNQADRAAGRTCSCHRRGRPFGMDRRDIELASCAHKRARIVRFAPRWWGQGGMSGASNSTHACEGSTRGSKEAST